MMTLEQAKDLVGKPLYSHGEEIGKVREIFVDDDTNTPEWVTLESKVSQANEKFVPLAQAVDSPDGLKVPYEKDTIASAPKTKRDADDGHLSQAQEKALYDHYGLGYTEGPSDSGLAAKPGDAGGITRSEERLVAGKEKTEAGRARLRKIVTTEKVSKTIPVAHEEARVVREPIDGKTGEGAEIREDEREVVLHEERPVAGKETVPVERVRLEKETVEDKAKVSEDIRKEQIEVDGADRKPRR